MTRRPTRSVGSGAPPRRPTRGPISQGAASWPDPTLLPGWTLMVSTALTFDRNGRCIEGSGIPVDVHVPRSDGERDIMLEAAERL